MSNKVISEEQFGKNRRQAKEVLAWVKSLAITPRNLEIVELISSWLSKTSTGYYSASEIEEFCCRLGGKINIDLPVSFKKNSCLFVTPAVGAIGGHTRVIERWIEKDADRIYSVATLQQWDGSRVPQRLRECIECRGGEIYLIGGHTIERAKKLREIASRYETIVLVMYTHELSHVIAFGSDNFKRPVGFYNATDHMFWAGVSVSDYFADIRPWGRHLSLQFRGVHESMIVPVPAETRNMMAYDRTALRASLGIPGDAKLIVSAARESKYMPLDGEDFAVLADALLDRFHSAIIITVGPNIERMPSWGSIVRKWGDRFRMMTYMPHDQLLNYFKTADLVLDSYPFGGITTLEDALDCGVPILSHAVSIDWVCDSPAFWKTIPELIEKTKMIFESSRVAQDLAVKMRERMLQFAGMEVFTKRVNEFMSQLQKKDHRVCKFKSIPTSMTRMERIRSVAIPILRRERILYRCLALRPRFLARSLIRLVLLVLPLWGRIVRTIRSVQLNVDRTVN